MRINLKRKSDKVTEILTHYENNIMIYKSLIIIL